VILRGGSKDVLNEIERNLQDAMQVVRNVMFDPRMLPGGGATELALCEALSRSQDSIEGISKWPYAAIGQALEVIPRTLAQNCGSNVIRTYLFYCSSFLFLFCDDRVSLSRYITACQHSLTPHDMSLTIISPQSILYRRNTHIYLLPYRYSYRAPHQAL
jgi:hypothetical protein